MSQPATQVCEVKCEGRRFQCKNFRYVLAVVCCLVNAIECSLKVVLSLTIVPMNQIFHWNHVTQGVVLGAFYYGTLITHIFGGQLASYFGPRNLIAFVLLVTSLLTVLTPLASQCGVSAFIVVRGASGLAQGAVSPAVFTLLARWVPPKDRGRCLAIFITGGNIGSLVILPLAGVLSVHGFAGGWPSVYYVLGIAILIIGFLWLMLVRDSPEMHPLVTDSEILSISAAIDVDKRKRTAKAPWPKILTSPPVWANVFARFTNSWSYYMLATKLPGYFSQVLNFSLKENGAINALVYLATIISMLMAGFLSDIIEAKHLLNRTFSRKLFEIISQLGTGLSLALVSFSGSSRGLAVSLFILAMLFNGFYAGGTNPNIVDLAPHYSGSIAGLGSAVASLCGIVAPLAVGFALDFQADVATAWDWIFYASTCISLTGGLIFILFGSAEPQAWGKLPTDGGNI